MTLTVPPTPETVSFSNSELHAFKRCKRRWFLSYYMGFKVRPEQESPVSTSRAGTRVHAALEGLYGHGLEPRDVLRAVYNLAAETYPGSLDDLTKEYDQSLAVIDGYYEWLQESGEDSQLEPVQAERVVTVKFADIDGIAVWIQARIDAVMARKTDGAVLFMDHKNVGSFTKANLLPIDEQMKTYVLIWRLFAAAEAAAGRPELKVDGGLFNMLKRSKRTARATPPFYKRVTVLYNKHDLESMWRRIHKTASDVIATRRILDQVFTSDTTEAARNEAQQYNAPPTPEADCDWSCPFLELCPMLDDGSRWQAALETNFNRGDPYEYLDTGILDQLIREERVPRPRR